MKTVTVQFQAWYFEDISVPEDWEPTSENLNILRSQAYSLVETQHVPAKWEATVGVMGEESFDLD